MKIGGNTRVTISEMIVATVDKASNSDTTTTQDRQQWATKSLPQSNHNENSMVVEESPEEEEANSDEEGTASLDEDGFPMVDDPCENILEEFESALSGDLEFAGTFAFSKTYEDAPNPLLCLEELGTIGLPLSPREARAIIENSIQAPFGQGERTVVDKEVRDTWETDATKVKFKEPAWATFMDKVVRDVCQTLGVNLEASKPRCELNKLLVYETGSHFLPHVDTEKTNGMFASIIVILPSPFTGGDAHISHGGLKSVFDTSKQSATKTTVISWYTDVMHEIKPITSGYRFALTYNLSHTTNSLRPSISSQLDSISPLRHILLSWKQHTNEPDKIIYMLNHKYSRANMSASALKGKDAHILGVLDSLAKELGFHLGLAHVEHQVSGYANDYGESYHRRNRFYDEYDHDHDDVEMGEIERQSTTIENLVDLDGKLISRAVDYDETETIPADFDGYFEDEKWDKQDYEGYQGNYGGTIDRFYRRSALVIWPQWTFLGREQVNRRTVYAIQRLQSLEGPEPTTEELELFDYAYRTTGSFPTSRTLKTLFQTAVRWKRVDLWVKCALLGQGREVISSTLSIEELVLAISQFGFSSIKAGVRGIVMSSKSITSRLKYLSSLEEWGKQNDHFEVVPFVQEMRSSVFEKLSIVDSSDLTTLTAEAIKYGGLQRLKQSVIPQVVILVTNSPEVIENYAAYLHTQSQRLAPNATDQSLLREIITGLLTSLIGRPDLTKVTPSKSYGYPPTYGTTPTLKGNPLIAEKFIKTCLDSGNSDVAANALKHMVETIALEDEVARARATTIFLPLLQLLDKNPSTKPFLLNLPLASLSEAAVPLALKEMEVKGGAVTREGISTLLDAIIVSGTPQLLETVIMPKIKSLPWNEANWKHCMEELHSRKGIVAFATNSSTPISITVVEMAKVYAQKVSLPNAWSTSAQYSNAYRFKGNEHYAATQIYNSSDFCLKFGGPAALDIVLNRVLPEQLSLNYLKSVLFPLTPMLVQLATMRYLSVTSEPFASAVLKIMDTWTRKVLGPKPSESAVPPLLANLKQWNCHQPYCVQVRNFLGNSQNERSIRLNRIGASSRKHIERELSQYARGAATFQTISTSPQGLIVSKSDALFLPSEWKATQRLGFSMLQTIGNENALMMIWGTNYSTFMNQMNGNFQRNESSVTGAVPGPSYGALSSTGLIQGSVTSIAGPSVSVTPAKRKAIEVDIDLTLSD